MPSDSLLAPSVDDFQALSFQYRPCSIAPTSCTSAVLLTAVCKERCSPSTKVRMFRAHLNSQQADPQAQVFPAVQAVTSADSVSQDRVLIGTELLRRQSGTGYYDISRAAAHARPAHPCVAAPHIQSDVKQVAALSSGLADVAVLGCRNGSVYMWDARVQSAVTPSWHMGSSVSKILKLQHRSHSGHADAQLVLATEEHGAHVLDTRMPGVELHALEEYTRGRPMGYQAPWSCTAGGRYVSATVADGVLVWQPHLYSRPVLSHRIRGTANVICHATSRFKQFMLAVRDSACSPVPDGGIELQLTTLG